MVSVVSHIGPMNMLLSKLIYVITVATNYLFDLMHLLGFEKQMFKRMNEKQATEREAYLWSVSDM